ncbi:hypothetical protein Salat_0135200 [Sesamum alatum]|uniref:Transmembrane protein n=1 Tax=Sesamum alatum TaxID=300844 RepID=A0AAE1YXC7_9LAMI|nr:hypothetical protein Salat_0135200 [Sesamum alatum]
MAAHSNRSPSPLSSRPINPNPRNSENNSTARRSFSGAANPFAKPSVLTNPRRFDPITPANSPSDFARRRSVSKEGTGSYLNCEEKENDEKDHTLKASRLHSPAKGSKNFMSPTISAASKFTPSPRKKVLVERNDPVRTSISLTDGKAMFFSAMYSKVSEDLESKSEVGYDQSHKTESSLDLNVADSEKKIAVEEVPPVSKPSKRVSFSDVPSDSHESLSESVVTDSDNMKLDSGLRNKDSCSSVSPSIPMLDADPSLPPYDPKTNYLSPRPQFLHYKPNPRIEILLNKEKGLDPDELKRLEDSFMAEIMSENYSDSEGTEESQTEDSQKEELEVTASADMVIGVEETEENPHVSEPPESLPVSTTGSHETSEESLVQKIEKKPWSLSRMMCFSILLMFLVACLSISVTHSPAFDNVVLQDLSLSDLTNFYHQSRVAAYARVNFDRLARHVNQFSVNSISFISKLANELGKGEKLGPLQFMNLSDLQKSSWSGEYNEASDELVDNLEEDELEEMDTEMEAFEEEEAYAEVVSDEKFEMDVDTQEEALESEEVVPDSVELAEMESEDAEDIQTQREVISTTNTEQRTDENSEYQLEDQSATITQDQESELEAAAEVASNTATETEKSHSDIISLGGPSASAADISSLEENSLSDVKSSSEEAQSSVTLESPQSSEHKPLAYYAMGICSLFGALLAVAAFTFQYKKNPSLANVVQATDTLLSKQKDYGLTGTNHHNIYQEKTFSENWQTEVDEIGESCASEMSSSFQKSASYSKKEVGGGASEAQSTERRTTRKYNKRESLASSLSGYSSGSPSYGSFTTLERIPIKNANGDEEIVTPVRRSSRIRKQVTSP